MFRPFANWPSSGWIKCQRNYIRTINIVISVSVSTEKGEGGRDPVYKKQGMCGNWWWKLRLKKLKSRFIKTCNEVRIQRIRLIESKINSSNQNLKIKSQLIFIVAPCVL